MENISNNTLIGAVNAENGKVNNVKNQFTGEYGSIPDVARAYKKLGKPWIIIADENYGEGSAREHAALQPRYLGCSAIITRSFARIHEANLKKQGILPLTFAKSADYDKVSGDDTVSIRGMKELAPGKPLKMVISKKTTGEKIEVELVHSLNENQISWIKAGSALNFIAKMQRN